jgi:MoxR-like ATPase
MLKTLRDQCDMEPRYIDCALLDLGDLQMPRVTDSVEFVPNKMFVGDEPLIIMLDEIGKAMRPVQNALLTLLLEHRIGNHKLPEGSVVFGTTNMARCRAHGAGLGQGVPTLPVELC